LKKQTINKKQKIADEDYAFALQLQEDIYVPPKKPVPKTSAYIIPLPLGVILFKGCLNMDEQLGIYKLVCELAELQQKAQNSNLETAMKVYSGYTTMKAANLIAPLLTYNWGYGVKIKEKPSDLLEFGKNMFIKARKYMESNSDIIVEENLKSHFILPEKYNPDGLHAILYPKGGKLMGHHDGIKGWVLSVSIGQSADFFFAPDGKKIWKEQL